MINFAYSKLSLLFLGVVLIALLFFLGKSIVSATKNPGQTFSDNRIEMPFAKSSVNINKEFNFPVLGDNGAEITKLKFNVVNAEKRDQIIVAGKTASAVKGRTFLILNLKITSGFDKNVTVNTRDYFRLSVNGNDKELLAPDIHNDPVEVQAKSTKATRVGFAVNDGDKNQKVLVGEINGDKTSIILNF